MSNGARSGKSFVDIAKERAKCWEERLKDAKDGPREADKLAARKHRLVALFRSENCYSANVHACTYGLGELVDSLVRLDRVPAQTSAEGLRLLAQAWDEHRRTQKDGLLGTARASCSELFPTGVMCIAPSGLLLNYKYAGHCQLWWRLPTTQLPTLAKRRIACVELTVGTTSRSTSRTATSGLPSFSSSCSCSSRGLLWPFPRYTAGALMIVPTARIARVKKTRGGS